LFVAVYEDGNNNVNEHKKEEDEEKDNQEEEDNQEEAMIKELDEEKVRNSIHNMDVVLTNTEKVWKVTFISHKENYNFACSLMHQ